MTGFRYLPKEELLRHIIDMTEKRFRVARHLLATKPWDFFMMVEIGLDRLHHAFWSHVDPEHPKHDPNHPLNGCVKEYYQLLDREVGILIDQFGPEATGQETDIYVVSDHGAQRMEGGFYINDWLIQEGYLVLKNTPASAAHNTDTNLTDASTTTPPTEPQPFDHSKVDWSKTRVWAEGGYYARLWLNIQGREPQGQLPPDEYESLCDELIQKLESLYHSGDSPVKIQIAKPEQIYELLCGVPPDIMAYIGDLRWRTLASTFHSSLFTTTNDTGADEANHNFEGLYLKNFVSEGNAKANQSLDTILAAGRLRLGAVRRLKRLKHFEKYSKVLINNLKELGYF